MSTLATLRVKFARSPGLLLAALSRLISITYLFLRATTASGALVAGLVQTFVFARVLTPHDFSIFILLASCGVSIYVLDFGVVKLLFVRMRAAYLNNSIDETLARQATGIVAFFTFFCVACTLICIGVFALIPDVSADDNMKFTLFFLFAALNFVWFALRNLSVAVDEFLFFESLEAVRRVGNVGLTLAMLGGFSLYGFLISINLLWGVLLALSIHRLMRRNALLLSVRGLGASVWSFYRDHRRDLFGSGVYGTTEIYIYAFPYLVVSAFFGLSAPTIIVDTAFKILRGAALLFAGACDLVVPRQTRAFAERDSATLVRATWLAVICCGVPAALLCGVLVYSADWMFRVLLDPAAVMPEATTPILIVLLIATLTQMVTHSLLVHAGFFKEVAGLGVAIAVALTAMSALAIYIGTDVIGFLKVYMGVYTCGALISVALTLQGPIRLAHEVGGAAQVASR